MKLIFAESLTAASFDGFRLQVCVPAMRKPRLRVFLPGGTGNHFKLHPLEDTLYGVTGVFLMTYINK